MVIFTLKLHSVVDVITNSSSELFVGTGVSKEAVVQLVEKVYPNYLDEYDEVKATHELTNSELDVYIEYKHNHYFTNSSQLATILAGVGGECPPDVIPGFTFDEMYKKGNYGTYLRHPFVTDENRERVIEAIDPNGVMFFLASLDDNPNWEYQEQLETIMIRYHIG